MSESPVAKKILSLSPAVLGALVLTMPLVALANEPQEEMVMTRATVPWNAMPMAGVRRESRTTAPIPDAPFCHLSYGGGPLISNVEVVAVNWTSAVPQAVQTKVPSFFQAITNSTYFDWLTEYNAGGQKIGRGTYKTQVTITPNTTSKFLSDTTIGREIVNQIASGALPKPSNDSAGNPNTIYMINFPPGYSITLDGAGSCVQFCAYHNAVQDAAGNYVYYGVHPDMSTGGCSRGCGPNANYLDNQTAVMSHELIEAVTDPIDNNAWVDQSQSCGEIGDICALGGAGEDDVIKGFSVQKEWSNKYGACIAVAPGASKGCTKDGDCTAPTAHCGTAGANLGNCVACVTNDHCSGATPVCDTTSNTCRACSNDADCGKDHCATSGANAGKCVACLTNDQCSNPSPVCATDGSCAGCKSDADCNGNSAGSVCESNGACGTSTGSSSSSGGSSGSSGSSSGDSNGSSGASGNGKGNNGNNDQPSSDFSSPQSGCAVSPGSNGAPGLLAFGALAALACFSRGRRRR